MYPESLVEHLLPTVWDETWAWGMQNPQAPDPDMPKAAVVSPKEATTFWCHLLDIKRAWHRTYLTNAERRAVLLHYGLGWTQDEIASHEQVSQKTISKRLSRSVERMTAFLNGELATVEESPTE